MADDFIPQNIYYVYVYFRLSGEPCYVGKGKGKRWTHHLHSCKNRHFRNIVNQAKALGHTIPHLKIREHLTEAQAIEAEVALIAAIGRRDLGTGPLVNMTAGGDGLSGHVKSEETLAKISRANKGRKFSEEHIKAMSLSRIGKPRSAESCEKQSKTITGRKRPEHAASLKGRPNPAVRAAQLGRKSPEHSERMTGNKNSLGKNLGHTRSRQKPAEEVLEIFHRAWAGESREIIAADFETHPMYVSQIKYAKVWKDVLSPLYEEKRLLPKLKLTRKKRASATVTQNLSHPTEM